MYNTMIRKIFSVAATSESSYRTQIVVDSFLLSQIYIIIPSFAIRIYIWYTVQYTYTQSTVHFLERYFCGFHSKTICWQTNYENQ